jgi:iron complex transport system permease protein
MRCATGLPHEVRTLGGEGSFRSATIAAMPTHIAPPERPWWRSPITPMVIALLLVAAWSLTVGAYPVTLQEALQAALGRFRALTGLTGAATALVAPGSAGTIDTVLFGIRLPRMSAAIAVGACLAAAGACYQAIFRNPLVSPDILGVSAGAGFGAVAGIFFSLPVVGVQLLAFVGGMATVGLVVVSVAAMRGREAVLSLILGGVVIGALAGACTSLLKVLADPNDELPAITFWLLGSLATVNGSDVLAVLPFALLGLAPLIALRWRIGVLSLDDEEAQALGVPVKSTRLLVIGCATLITSSVVAIAGVIGWVGLVIPHVARMLVGPSFSRLLPASAVLGAAYLLLVDTLARSLSNNEIPLGILTAVVGAPFFLWLLAHGRRGWA